MSSRDFDTLPKVGPRHSLGVQETRAKGSATNLGEDRRNEEFRDTGEGAMKRREV